jgi:hypothetical protein
MIVETFWSLAWHVKVKAKVTLKQDMKAQRWSKGIAELFL